MYCADMQTRAAQAQLANLLACPRFGASGKQTAAPRCSFQRESVVMVTGFRLLRRASRSSGWSAVRIHGRTIAAAATGGACFAADTGGQVRAGSYRRHTARAARSSCVSTRHVLRIEAEAERRDRPNGGAFCSRWLARVRAGVLAYVRGVFVRDVKTSTPIDGDTVFRIASMSRASRRCRFRGCATRPRSHSTLPQLLTCPSSRHLSAYTLRASRYGGSCSRIPLVSPMTICGAPLPSARPLKRSDKLLAAGVQSRARPGRATPIRTSAEHYWGAGRKCHSSGLSRVL